MRWSRVLLCLWALGARAPAQQPGAADAISVDVELRAALDRFFAADAKAQAEFAFDAKYDAELATRSGDRRLRELAWESYRDAPHERLRADFAEDRVTIADRTSRYKVAKVGERPPGGWPLVLAMHGGGGVAALENDQQWEVMQRYYRPHPEQSGYLYCAVRAPNDAWNGFYDDAFTVLCEQLVRQFVVCADVDADHVCAIGYSHGGYGAFWLATKIPHRFAAVHASAAAPTDGECSALGLHDLAFSFMVGGRDDAHGRRERCLAFGAQLQALRAQYPGAYATTCTVVDGNGHTGLPDRDLLPVLLTRTRTAMPRELHWEPTDATVHDHYWLHAERPGKGLRLDARLSGQQLTATVPADAGVTALLDARSVDLAAELVVTVGGASRTVRPAASLRTLCATMARFGDARLAGSARVSLP